MNVRNKKRGALLARMLLLIEKRLFKTPSFLIILALILFFALFFSFFSSARNGGMIRVGFYAPQGDEELAQISLDLLKENDLLICTRYESEEEARNAVISGKEDTAWVFYPDYTRRCRAFLDEGAAVVRCYEKENNVLLNLSREKLFSFLFDRVSRDVFAQRMKELSGEEPTEEQIAQYYVQDVKKDRLILFYTLEDSAVREEDFVLSPLRGLLLLFVLCGGLAAAVQLAQDEKNGVFLILPRLEATVFRLLSVFLTTLNLSAAVYIALAALGLLTAPLFDLLLLLCHAFAATGLVYLLLELLQKPLPLAVSMLPVIFGTISLTPIFYNVRALRALSYLFPGYYALIGAKDPGAALLLIAYGCIAFALAALCRAIRRGR